MVALAKTGTDIDGLSPGAAASRRTRSRSRSWSRSRGADAGRGRAGQDRGSDRALRALGDRRRGVVGGLAGSAPSASCARARSSARCRSERWSTECPLYDLSRPGPGQWPDTADVRTVLRLTPAAPGGEAERAGGDVHNSRGGRNVIACLAGVPERRRQGLGVSRQYAGSSARTRCAGPRPPTRRSSTSRGGGDDRGRDQQQRPAGRLQPIPGTVEAVLKCARTSPAMVPASGSPTASTSPTRRTRTSPGGSTATTRALADACGGTRGAGRRR